MSIGFKDPDNIFPVEEYKGQQKTNLAVRGEWTPKIVPPEGQPFEIPLEAQPEYPHNKEQSLQILTLKNAIVSRLMIRKVEKESHSIIRLVQLLRCGTKAS